MDAETPMVSVIMLTHNQKRYVRQAVESVLMQEADFKYELLICDDASTDGTKEIIGSEKTNCSCRCCFWRSTRNTSGVPAEACWYQKREVRCVDSVCPG